MADTPIVVFVSYARSDSAFVFKLVEDLNRANIGVWVDQQQLSAGTPWDSAVEENILASHCLLVILSPNSVRSDNVRDECSFARRYNKPIIPILHSDCNIPLGLDRLQYIDFRSDYERGLQALLDNLAGLSKKRASSRAPWQYLLDTLRPQANKRVRIRRELLTRVRHTVNDYFEKYIDAISYIRMRLDVRPILHSNDPNIYADGLRLHVSSETTFLQIFREHGSALVILGDGGSGKTTLLVELARDLLMAAERDDSQPIPVVINLSSRTRYQDSVNACLRNELVSYGINTTIVDDWIRLDQILPLFDSLDELSAKDRAAWVQSINNYRREHGSAHVAVCCRTVDYESLSENIHVPVVVMLRPLTGAQIATYLAAVGLSPEILCTMAGANGGITELFSTLLMLRIAAIVLAGSKQPQPELMGSNKKITDYLFNAYVTRMLERRNAPGCYSEDFVRRCLSWLAKEMSAREWSSFSPDDLSTDWLPHRLYRYMFVLGVTTCVALISTALVILCIQSYVTDSDWVLPAYQYMVADFYAVFFSFRLHYMAAGGRC